MSLGLSFVVLVGVVGRLLAHLETTNIEANAPITANTLKTNDSAKRGMLNNHQLDEV